MKNQKGFTLVEMAIVLVIIGLLLGGVLKGQELIDNSRIKNAVNDLKGISAAYNGYFDRFRAVPGDDGPLATLELRGAAWTPITKAATASNGVLDVIGADTFTATDEGTGFFQHLRAAGFLTGNPASEGVAAMPVNPFGGLLGVNGNITTAVLGFPLNTKLICMGSVPGKAARAIDTSMDDGVANTGLLKATVSTTANTAPGAAVTTYSDDSNYTICTTM
jgi:prepilin-type N-terminal cleavage/methylation domain-containing protein